MSGGAAGRRPLTGPLSPAPADAFAKTVLAGLPIALHHSRALSRHQPCFHVRLPRRLSPNEWVARGSRVLGFDALLPGSARSLPSCRPCATAPAFTHRGRPSRPVAREKCADPCTMVCLCRLSGIRDSSDNTFLDRKGSAPCQPRSSSWASMSRIPWCVSVTSAGVFPVSSRP